MPDVQIADTLEVALATDLASVPQVRHILIEWNDGPLIVWIAVDDPDPGVRRLIYQKGLIACGRFVPPRCNPQNPFAVGQAVSPV